MHLFFFCSWLQIWCFKFLPWFPYNNGLYSGIVSWINPKLCFVSIFYHNNRNEIRIAGKHLPWDNWGRKIPFECGQHLMSWCTGLNKREKTNSTSIHFILLPKCRCNVTSCPKLQPWGNLCDDGLYLHNLDPNRLSILKLLFINYLVTGMRKIANIPPLLLFCYCDKTSWPRELIKGRMYLGLQFQRDMGPWGQSGEMEAGSES